MRWSVLAAAGGFALLADGSFWLSWFGHASAQGVLAKNSNVPTRLDVP